MVLTKMSAYIKVKIQNCVGKKMTARAKRPSRPIKGKQLTLTNRKGAGRKAIHDRGIRHIAREDIKRKSAFHLTIKIASEKAGLKNKNILSVLHLAIKNARCLGLTILHYTLEYDHVHLLVEASDKKALGRGMKSFGVSFSKGINRFKRQGRPSL